MLIPRFALDGKQQGLIGLAPGTGPPPSGKGSGEFVHSCDDMAMSVRLGLATEARLDRLASKTRRTKAFYLRQLIEQGMDDLEDAYLGSAAVERIRLGQERTYSLDEVVAELGLDASDL
ncbi:hypothetical protein [Cyanobium gracile]|uniref:Uncharacterized protein n=1 Tax=Cyanobium gracile UHCC 0281 TaxID=3110309 RepID=A0ABU5SRN9_9CYAN|nr:hypothetical protein [Cyanobium gracile]MEA5441108.1 hypothetical protein [Cyanobium gracile UHCC 0281]